MANTHHLCILFCVDIANVGADKASLGDVIESPEAPSQTRLAGMEHLEPVPDPILNHAIGTAATTAAVLVALIYAAGEE